MMPKKICLLLFMLILIGFQAEALNFHPGKGSSVLDKADKSEEEDTDKTDDDDKHNDKNDIITPPTTSRRNRYHGYGSSLNNHRSRSRWPTSYDDNYRFDDRSGAVGHDISDILSSLSGYFPPPAFDTAPACYSILDPQYALFSDVCGVVPQARYSLPNLFGHVERWQIAQALTLLMGSSGPTSANPGCTRAIRLLVCPMLFPPCHSRREVPPSLPCQPFCQAVKAQCPAPSLDLLPCDYLPPSSDICPVNPLPYSSLLGSFGSSFPMNGALPPATLPPTGFSSFLNPSVPPSPFPSAVNPSPFPPSSFPPSSFPPSSFPTPPMRQLPYPSFFPKTVPTAPQSIPTARPTYSPMGSMNGFTPSLSAGSSIFRQTSDFFDPTQYAAESMKPILVDFPSVGRLNNGQSKIFPTLRSGNVKA